MSEIAKQYTEDNEAYMKKAEAETLKHAVKKKRCRLDEDSVNESTEDAKRLKTESP